MTQKGAVVSSKAKPLWLHDTRLNQFSVWGDVLSSNEQRMFQMPCGKKLAIEIEIL